MSNEILDDVSESEAPKHKRRIFQMIGNFLIFAAFALFISFKWALISLLLCFIGTVLIWLSPRSWLDKIMASIPLLGFIYILYSYYRLAELLYAY